MFNEVLLLTTRTLSAHFRQLKPGLAYRPDLSPFQKFSLQSISKSFRLYKVLKTLKTAYSVNSMAIAAILENDAQLSCTVQNRGIMTLILIKARLLQQY